MPPALAALALRGFCKIRVGPCGGFSKAQFATPRPRFLQYAKKPLTVTSPSSLLPLPRHIHPIHPSGVAAIARHRLASSSLMPSSANETVGAAALAAGFVVGLFGWRGCFCKSVISGRTGFSLFDHFAVLAFVQFCVGHRGDGLVPGLGGIGLHALRIIVVRPLEMTVCAAIWLPFWMMPGARRAPRRSAPPGGRPRPGSRGPGSLF